MLQEKCVREITNTLQMSMMRSFLAEFASRLDVSLKQDGSMQPEGDSQPGSGLPPRPGGFGLQAQRAADQTPSSVDPRRTGPQTPVGARAAGQAPPDSAELPSLAKRKEKQVKFQEAARAPVSSMAANMSGINLQFVDQPRAEPPVQMSAQLDKERLKEVFEQADVRGKARILKKLATVTPQDEMIETRQKHGQLKFGDIVMLFYQEDVHQQHMKETMYSQQLEANVDAVLDAKPKQHNLQRVLDTPDLVYRGYIFSDGVTDRGMKVVPYNTGQSLNAVNMFKQCLFRVEIKQSCDRTATLNQLTKRRNEIQRKLEMLKSKGSQAPGHHEETERMQADLEAVTVAIAKAKKDKEQQDMNNVYEQDYRHGSKLTFGTVVQLKHLFSGEYLTMSSTEMSSEFGCSKMLLDESSEFSWFTIEEAFFGPRSHGNEINYSDYFHIRSYSSSSPFYLHVNKKVVGSCEHELREDKILSLNAGQAPSLLKAKLFISYTEASQEKKFIQSGDVIRLKHLEANSYLTTSACDVEQLLPSHPDFLKGQIQRMYSGEQVERQKGGLDITELTDKEKVELMKGQDFKPMLVDNSYVRFLKSKAVEKVYIEKKQERLLFSNSCWEIQRVNPLHGGIMRLNEVVRLRHVGTGKFLAVTDDMQHLELKNSSNYLTSLFVLKSDLSGSKEPKFQNDEEDVITEEEKQIRPGQRIIIQSFMDGNYLQLEDQLEDRRVTQFKHLPTQLHDPFKSSDDKQDSQLKLINHSFQKKDKVKMIFYIEDISKQDAVNSYQSTGVLDELLEFYAFINIWGVQAVDLEEATEKYFFSDDLARQTADELQTRVGKLLNMLENLEERINKQQDVKEQNRAKKEVSEQGMLDLLCELLTLFYLKTAPPPLFCKPFKSKRTEAELDQNKVLLEGLNMHKYQAQQIARMHLNAVLRKILEIILLLVRRHRHNSELCTQYSEILYQHLELQEQYIELMKMREKKFKPEDPQGFINLIFKIYKKVHKQAVYIHGDKSSLAHIELPLNPSNPADGTFLATDSNSASKLLQTGAGVNQLQKWLDLLETVRYTNDLNQNLAKQINITNIISMFCKDNQGRGIFTYQMQVYHHLFEEDDHIPLKFGTARFGNVLRPFVYFARPRTVNPMSLEEFGRLNPILQENANDFDLVQRQTNQYDMVLDLHDMTRKCSTPGIEMWKYIDYICAVINMYAHVCLSANVKAIQKLKTPAVGLDESHILLCIHHDTDMLIIHEKFKAAYMFLARCMFIDNNPLAPGIVHRNMCFNWSTLIIANPNYDDGSKKTKDDLHQIENDFYSGKAQLKEHQMDNPNNSMIVLHYDQETKDLELIRMIRSNIESFLLEGIKGTQQAFENKFTRKFAYSHVKLKIKSLKIYLDAIYFLLAEDCVSPKFIQNIKLVCECAMVGALGLNQNQEKNVPTYIQRNWVYALMWVCKEVAIQEKENREMQNAIKGIELKILSIFLKLSVYRTSLQVKQFLVNFRKFQVRNSQSYIAFDDDQGAIEQQFMDLFKLHQLDLATPLTEKYTKLKQKETNDYQKLMDSRGFFWHLFFGTGVKKKVASGDDPEEVKTQQLLKEAFINKHIPLDVLFINYIYQNSSDKDVRMKAIQVLTTTFFQREALVRELSRVDLLVSPEDSEQYQKVKQQQKDLQLLAGKLVMEEWHLMIYNKTTGLDAKKGIADLVAALEQFIAELQQSQGFKKKRIQNFIRHLGILFDVLNGIMKRLIYQTLTHKVLFQTCIDFLYESSFDNANIQKLLLPNFDYFLDLINKQIEVGSLINEIVKASQQRDYMKDYAQFLINKIVLEKRFKSSLLIQLAKIAATKVHGQEREDDDPLKSEDVLYSNTENPFQRFILQQIIHSSRFRTLIMMRRKAVPKKMTIIKIYSKKREQYNIAKKEEDENILADKEALEVHLAAIDLLSACAQNSPFCIQQAQRLMELEELLDSLLSDAIPFILKKHYLRLLYEVYLRKVPPLDESNRMDITHYKFAQVLKWVLLYDVKNSYAFYYGLVREPKPDDSPELQRKLQQVNREVDKAAEKEYEEQNAGRTDKEKEDEKKFKAALTSHEETQAIQLLNTNDKMEFWEYVYSYDPSSRLHDGILVFLENLYRDYSLKELNEPNMIDITNQFRNRILDISTKIFVFIDNYGDFIKPYVQLLLIQMNKAVQKIPMNKAFIAKKRIMKDDRVEEIDDNQVILTDESLNVDDSRDVDNKLKGEKILGLLKDTIIRQNVHIREGLGIRNITSDIMISREVLKDRIKKMVREEATYEEIMKALDHFHSVSVDKKQERQVMNVEPGQQGYIMYRIEGQVNIEDEMRNNKINFKDIELQLKEVLKKANYKPPNQQREREGENAEFEKLEAQIEDDELSLTINMDFKLFTQRLSEFIHVSMSMSEVTDFVNKLMKLTLIQTKEGKLQFIKNMLAGFIGLGESRYTKTLIDILILILERHIPSQEQPQVSKSYKAKILKQQPKAKLLEELKEWQQIMLQADVPRIMLKYITVDCLDNFLSNRALLLINNILCFQSIAEQQHILDILKENDTFFEVFKYIKQRIRMNKESILERCFRTKKEFEKLFANVKTFADQAAENQTSTAQNLDRLDFGRQMIYMQEDYDVEKQFEEKLATWKEDEVYNLLDFINHLSDNCLNEAQLYLRQQLEKRETNFKGISRGKITSIDLISEVVHTFVEIIDKLGRYVFSDWRTTKLVPRLLETLIQFIQGPCVQNQEFIGSWLKVIKMLNLLMSSKEMGNYAGVHLEAKSQLQILHACSRLLLAIIDIKDPEIALKVHKLILAELDTQNLVEKMVDIYIFKIGGSYERRRIYEYGVQCNHFTDGNKTQRSKCIQNEYCEKGYFIPRDFDTIETGFNIFQILLILNGTCGEDRRLDCFKTDELQYLYLKKDDKVLFANVSKRLKEEEDQPVVLQARFTKTESKLLEEVISRCFPESYIKYIEQVAQKRFELIANPEQGEFYEPEEQIDKKSKLAQDKEQQLEKIKNTIRSNAEREVLNLENEEGEQEEITNEGATVEELIDDPNKPEEEKKQPEEVKAKEGFLSKLAKLCKSEKVEKVQEHVKAFEEMDDEEKKEKASLDRMEFIEKLKLYKFYIASSFYKDNIGSVEVVNQEGNMVTTTFQMPSIVRHLSPTTRDGLPYLQNKVSQPEKLEAFMGELYMLEQEMLWQQRVGSFSRVIKAIANNWEIFPWINFVLVCIINVLLITYLRPNAAGEVNIHDMGQREFIDGLGLFQTCVAGVAIVAYYLESRADMKSKVEKASQTAGVSDDISGSNKGSVGYGARKGRSQGRSAHKRSILTVLKQKGQKNLGFKLAYLLLNEVKHQILFVLYNMKHARNIFYFFLSIYAKTEGGRFVYSIMLLELTHKVKALSIVISIFDENKMALVATLGFFTVMLYIISFYSLYTFRDSFKHSVPLEGQPQINLEPYADGKPTRLIFDNYELPDVPEFELEFIDLPPRSEFTSANTDIFKDKNVQEDVYFNLYCSTLYQCLLTTINFGLRAKGGLGSVLSQMHWTDDGYFSRYIFDVAFFVFFNMIVVNVFSGIIIDSFSSKRAMNVEIFNEVNFQCFICGISKRKFDVEQVPWKEHIFIHHNLHSYIAFMLYVKHKEGNRCNGIEKYVKKCLKEASLDFFPVLRSARINGGKSVS